MPVTVMEGKCRLTFTEFQGVIAEDIFMVTTMRTPVLQDRPLSLFMIFVFYFKYILVILNAVKLTALIKFLCTITVPMFIKKVLNIYTDILLTFLVLISVIKNVQKPGI